MKTQAKYWHREIDTIIKNLQAKADRLDSNILAVLDEQEDKIRHSVVDIQQNIANIRNLLNINDV